jgi:hypothetical protein
VAVLDRFTVRIPTDPVCWRPAVLSVAVAFARQFILRSAPSESELLLLHQR